MLLSFFANTQVFCLDQSVAHATMLLGNLLSMHQRKMPLLVSLKHTFIHVDVDHPAISALGNAAVRSAGFDVCWQWILMVGMCDVHVFLSWGLQISTRHRKLPLLHP